ncbi:MAG: hypothetical protein ABW022_04590 [Actinoplanes sp.]
MDLPGVRGHDRLTRILCGVARNPSAPPEVVRRLLRLPVTARVVARHRPDLTGEQTDAILALGDVESAVALASNQQSPLPVRWRLAAHPDPRVRSAVAGPALPVTLFKRLAADPDTAVRCSVAGHDRTPDDVHLRLALDPAPQVRQAVAERWRRAPEPVRRALLTDPHPGVRAAALSPGHPAPPPDLHAPLLADEATRHLMVPHVELTDALAADLADAPAPVRVELAGRRDLPTAVRDQLATDTYLDVRLRLLLNPDVPDDLRTRLLADLDAEDRFSKRFIVAQHLANAWQDMAWLRNAPLPERLAYLDSPHPWFRQAVAASPDLPRDAIDRLLADPDVRTRQITAKHHDVPGEALERLVLDHGDLLHVHPLLVNHPSFPADAFTRLARSDSTIARLLALHGSDLPTGLVDHLLDDPELEIRRAAARHPNVPMRRLPALLTGPDPDMAESAGAAPAMPPGWFPRLLAECGL